MNALQAILFAAVPALVLAGCGGGDTADRVDHADPVVRFVHASPVAPDVTHFQGTAAQGDASNVSYKFASNYFDIGTGVADWSVEPSAGGPRLGSVTIDPQRGTRYTIVALADSPNASSVQLIVDPYNKPLTSDSTRLRVMNAAFDAASIDLYLLPAGATVGSATPTIANTAFKTAGPASGDDSISVAAGTYVLAITPAGSKTVLFNAPIAFVKNQDVLLLAVPDAGSAIKVLEKVEGTPGATEVPAS
jgi:hypothetical protein